MKRSQHHIGTIHAGVIMRPAKPLQPAPLAKEMDGALENAVAGARPAGGELQS